MAWKPLNNLGSDLNMNDGIIRLWHSPNLRDGSDWKTNGEFGKDIYYFFIIPSGFYYSGDNEFSFNFSFKYIFEPVEYYYRGIRYTENFWRLEESSHVPVSLMTDNETKLPYVLTADVGMPNQKTVKNYFIPITGLA